MNLVDAVKDENQRNQIEGLLLKKGQIFSDIWFVGINTALRISDLRAITTEQIKAVDPIKCELPVFETKTSKHRLVTLNDRALDIVKRRVAENPKNKLLWQSPSPRYKHTHHAISRNHVARVFKAVGEQINPPVKLSTHSMRKTRGYYLHTQGVPIEVISKMLNHADISTTMRYIGLDAERIGDTYKDHVL